MDFLAIDLEACNTYVKGSVFSIGIVCADENFKVKYKRNILINPKCKVAMHFRKPIEFHIDMADLANKPTISDYYAELKEIFSGDVLVLAHSANNDMYMLNHALRRAGLKPFKFQYICSQVIYSAVYDYPTGIGLDKVSEDLHIGFTHHLADDDAEMCLYLLKHCMEKMGCNSYAELETKLKIQRGHVENYELFPMRSGYLDALRVQHRIEKAKAKKKLIKESQAKGAVSFKVQPHFFDLIKSGSKKIEIRLNDEKRRTLKVGDVIFLVKESAKPDILKVQITKLDVRESFLEIYESYSSDELGFKESDLLDFLSVMAEFYSPEDEKKCGVVAIKFKVLNN